MTKERLWDKISLLFRLAKARRNLARVITICAEILTGIRRTGVVSPTVFFLVGPVDGSCGHLVFIIKDLNMATSILLPYTHAIL